MSPQTMTEKDVFLTNFEREYQTTLRVLKSYPTDQAELKPAEKLKSARELAWMLALNQMVLQPTIDGSLKPGGLPPAPATFAEVIAGFEKAHRDTAARLAASTEAEWNATLNMPVGPKQMADVRRGDALWFFHHDTIHHRGQFTVYVRLAGAKLPSVYGPTADEQWW